MPSNWKVTVPVAVEGTTVAVIVVLWPETVGFTDDVIDVAVVPTPSNTLILLLPYTVATISVTPSPLKSATAFPWVPLAPAARA